MFFICFATIALMTSQVVSVEREDESDYDYLEGDWWRSDELIIGLLLYLFIVEYYRFSENDELALFSSQRRHHWINANTKFS